MSPPQKKLPIAILPLQHNAFKNMSLALEGQQRLREAIEAFIRATELCPEDSRALTHAENLLSANENAIQPSDELKRSLERCRYLVNEAIRDRRRTPPEPM